MAFYREIKVDGKIYEYHVGKNFIKIKGLKENSNIKKLISSKTIEEKMVS